MSTLWPLILDQRASHTKKLVTLLIFTTMEVFRNKAKGSAETNTKSGENGQKGRNKKKRTKNKKG